MTLTISFLGDLRTDFDSWEEVVLYAKRKAKERIKEEMLKGKKTSNSTHPPEKLEGKIEELLEDEALPVCAIRKALEESGEKKINRRALWRKIKKLERWAG